MLRQLLERRLGARLGPMPPSRSCAPPTLAAWSAELQAIVVAGLEGIAQLYRDATRRFAEDHDDAMRGGGPQYTCCAPEAVARRETTAESPTRPHYTDRTAT